MLKNLLRVLVLGCVLTPLFAGGTPEASSGSADAGKKAVTIEVVATQPEYLAQDKQIWELYMEENPHVTIKVTTLNEDQRTAHLARIAANEGPAIMSLCFPVLDKSTYKTYVNLLDIDYPYWDQLSYDGKKLVETELGIKDYVPTVQLFNTFTFSFIYYKDEMAKAGLDPSVMRSWDDVDKFLAELKKYVDKTPGIDYVLDTGWHPWVWGLVYPNIFSLSMGATIEELGDLYTGKIAWTDLEKNPMVPFFKKIKEYYEKGYMPQNWLGRDWENEFEAGFINRKSILTAHGPWLWDKVLAADPSAELGGVPFPAGKGGKLAAYPVSSTEGSAILAQYQDREEYDEIVKAFIWYNSPEIAELRAQFVGSKPNFNNLSPDFKIDHPQYVNLVKPTMEGDFGPGLQWDNSPWGTIKAGPFKVEGKPEVLMDDALTEPLGKYFRGEMSLKDLMTLFQGRWEEAYDFN